MSSYHWHFLRFNLETNVRSKKSFESSYEYHKGLEGHIHFPKKEVIQKFYTMDGQ
jgi:hypothetical protein